MPGDWFHIVKGKELEQGDMLFACPVYSVSPVFPVQEGAAVDVQMEPVDLIIMSQSCDLVEGREKIDHVVLCAVSSLSDAMATKNHALNDRGNRNSLVKNMLVSLHALDACKLPEAKREFSVVHFAQVFTLPIPYVRAFASQQGERLRLNTPYREHLSQRFSFFFGRIALPNVLTLPAEAGR